MEFWNRQIKMARYMLLATLIVTVLNVVFLLGNVDFYISYCAALPYYLVWLGKLFDNGLQLGAINGEFTATGLFMAGMLLSVWLAVWWLSFGRSAWLKVGLILVMIDLGILLVAAVVLFGNPVSCLWEIIIHVAVIWEMARGLKAWKQMEEHLSRRTERSAPVEEYV